MSVKRVTLSLLFVWHVVAIALGALESPGVVLPVGPPRHPTYNRAAAAITPVLDRVAAVIAPVPDAILHSAGPVRALAARYREVTGVSQSWKMFTNPPQRSQYLRVRHYIGPRAQDPQSVPGPRWTATELVLPAHREDRIRFLRAFWNSYQDKAETVALQRFQTSVRDRTLGPDTKSAELPDDIAPIGRYFARRFQREALKADERILRTEIWYGEAPMPVPGQALDSMQVEARRAVLLQYYQGPVENYLGPQVYPPYGSNQAEADIRWHLEYFEP